MVECEGCLSLSLSLFLNLFLAQVGVAEHAPQPDVLAPLLLRACLLASELVVARLLCPRADSPTAAPFGLRLGSAARGTFRPLFLATRQPWKLLLLLIDGPELVPLHQLVSGLQVA